VQEKRPRELTLANAFESATGSVLQLLSPMIDTEGLINYIHFDFSMVAKDRSRNVVAELNRLLAPVLDRSGFFLATSEKINDPKMQFQVSSTPFSSFLCSQFYLFQHPLNFPTMRKFN
jgi:hypothetical protein